MADTLREQIMAALKAQIETMKAGEPASDPYLFTPSQVVRGPLGEPDNRKRLSIGLIDGEELKQTRYPHTDVQLRIAIEFQFTHNRGDDEPSVMANRVLGDLQRKVCEDRRLGGLVIDVNEVGNDIDLDGDSDKSIEGALFVVVRFRHATDDPRQPV